MRQKEPVPETGKDEMNLVEYPITLMSKRHEVGVKTLKFSDTITGDGGKLIKREWVVTGSDEYGLPLTHDNDVLLALLALGKEQGFQSRKIHFSRYRLCQIMGWKLGGANYRRIEETFKRLTGVSIFAKNALWDNKRKGYVTMGFGIIGEFYLYDSPRSPEQDTFPFSYATLSDVLFESIKAGYIKSIDVKAYYLLDGSITKRLYRYLDKKRYDGKRKFEIELFSLAETRLGLQKTKYASHIKEKLNPAHEELIQAGFLRSAEYQKTADGSSEKVIYTFGKKTDQAEPGSTPPAKEKKSPAEHPAREDDPLLQKLLEIGVTRGTAEHLLKEHPAETIQAQIEALPYREAKEPPAALISSINEGWSLPAAYKEALQRKSQEEEERLQKEQKKSQEAELKARVEEYLSELSEEQKAELRQEALELARLEGGSAFQGKKILEPALKAYESIIVRKRLEAVYERES